MNRIGPSLIALLVAPLASAQTTVNVFSGSNTFRARGVSRDGVVLVGFVPEPWLPEKAARWTAGSGVQVLAPALLGSAAVCANEDGSVIAGSLGGTFATTTTWRWTAAGGFEHFPRPPGTSGVVPVDISADGQTIVGNAGIQGPTWTYLVWRWTPTTGVQALPLAGATGRFAVDMSADGTRIIGQSLVCPGAVTLQPECLPGWIWTEAGGYEDLVPPPGATAASARAISGDGTLIAGTYAPAPPASWAPHVWLGIAPAWSLGPVPGGGGAVPVAASFDGSVIVGDHNVAGQWYSWIWRDGLGMRDLSQFLLSYGAPGFGGWSWPQVRAMSDNGRVLIGDGYLPSGNYATWRVVIDPACYADCNADWQRSVSDFGCFQTRFVAADSWADCNADSALTIADFACFQTKFAAGCP